MQATTPSNGAIYQTFHTFCCKGTFAKYRPFSKWKSDEFFCRRDPDPAIFMLTFNLDLVNNTFYAHCRVVNRALTISMQKFRLYNSKGALLATKMFDAARDVEKGKESGDGLAYDVHDSTFAEDKWRLVFEVEYASSSPEEYQPRVAASNPR